MSYEAQVEAAFEAAYNVSGDEIRAIAVMADAQVQQLLRDNADLQLEVATLKAHAAHAAKYAWPPVQPPPIWSAQSWRK